MSLGMRATSIVGSFRWLRRVFDPSPDSWWEIQAPGAEVRSDAEGHVAAATFLGVAAAQELAAVEVASEDVEALGLGEDALVVVGRHVDHVHQ